MEGDYVYRPLSRPQNIRVLKLEPAKNLEDPLVGCLEEIDPGVVEYDALSYSWAMEDGKGGEGDSSPTKSMFLDGQHILIGQNLRDALRRLRQMPTAGQAAMDDCKQMSRQWADDLHRLRQMLTPQQSPSGDRKQPSRIWADALCINQRDDLEKSVQVAMMASIYRNAAMVVAWLGEGDAYRNSLAFKAIQCLAIEASMHQASGTLDLLLYDHKWTQRTKWELGEDSEQCPACLNMDPEPGEVELLAGAVKDLSLRRYFGRLWVVQEVVTRHTDQVMFQWGAHKWAGDPLRLLEMFSIDDNFSLSRIEFMPVSYKLGTSPAWPFERWMEFCSFKHCFDPRDVVYAVLGCVKEAPLRPDYRKSVPEVYADFARYLLERRCFITVLRNAVELINTNRIRAREGSRPMADGWPTWLLNPGLIPFKLLEDHAKSAATWDYAQPSMNENELVLSCHMAYKGTVASKRLVYSSSIDRRWSYEIIWEARQERDGIEPYLYHEPGTPLEHGALRNRTVTDIGYNPIAIVGDGSLAHRHVDLEVGDVLCDFAPCEEIYDSLQLRQTERPGFWEIIGRFWFQERYYCDPARPKERRLFHLV